MHLNMQRFYEGVKHMLIMHLFSLRAGSQSACAMVAKSWEGGTLLSCQPRVTVTLCFVYKVIRDLESIDNLCINPIRRIG